MALMLVWCRQLVAGNLLPAIRCQLVKCVVTGLPKYAPKSIHQEIANIFNITASTGDVPTALIHGLLCPLQKPGKKKGPPENLRPIILLSILRKILTITLLDRTWKRLEEKIPKTQAAYQRDRGTTEQVLALKLIIEKAINSSDLDIYILLLDMSKAFDTVNRKILLSDLASTLNPDEVHLLGGSSYQ